MGLEKRIVRRDWMYLLPITGWVDRNILGKLEFLLRLIPSLVLSFYILLRYRPDVILITGGFVSVPVGIAGIIFRTPIFTLILDSYPGLAVRYLSRYSVEVFLPFHGLFPGIHASRKTVTGIPLREDILSADKNEAIKYFSLDKNKKTLLMLGGSRGAKTLVLLAGELISRLDRGDWQFIIQTGKHKLKRIGKNTKEVSFIERIDLAYAIADIIISRAGAMVTAEIERIGIPTIFIPYRYASEDHQFHNAKRLASKRDNITVVREEEINIEELVETIDHLFVTRLNVVQEDASEKIVKRIEEYVWKN